MKNFNNIKQVSESLTELLGEPVGEGFVSKMTKKERYTTYRLLEMGDEIGARKILDGVKEINKHQHSDKTNWYLKQKQII
jgi:hypothetical protein